MNAKDTRFFDDFRAMCADNAIQLWEWTLAFTNVLSLEVYDLIMFVGKHCEGAFML
jgi:hypothetical protein